MADPLDAAGEIVAIFKDFFGGWSLFTGFTRPVQVDLARAFYESVTELEFRGEAGFVAPSNITLTGHSLGGALAGMTGVPPRSVIVARIWSLS